MLSIGRAAAQGVRGMGPRSARGLGMSGGRVAVVRASFPVSTDTVVNLTDIDRIAWGSLAARSRSSLDTTSRASELVGGRTHANGGKHHAWT